MKQDTQNSTNRVKCECKFGAVCNDKQRWNNDKFRSECKQLIDEGVCKKGFIWNPSNCECEFDKACYALKTASVEKNQLINQLMNVLKLLKI